MHNIKDNTDAKLVFGTLATASKAHGENKDCTVKAVAITCGVDYATAHAAMKEMGRPNRRGASTMATIAAARSLGFRVERITDRGVCYAAKTMKTVGRALLSGRERGGVLVFVRGHVAAVVNGHVADWTNNRQHRVKEMYRVIPNAEVAPEKKPAKKKTIFARDRFGYKNGSKAAMINMALSSTPQTMKELVTRCGLEGTFYNHMKKMVAAGHVVKGAGGYRLVFGKV